MIATLEEPLNIEGEGARADERRLRGLIDSHAAAVGAVLRRRYAGALAAVDVDDVIAIATHRMWRHAEKLDGLSSPRAWFLRVADNVARDVLRYGWHKARRLEVAADAAWLGSFPEPAVAAEPVDEVEPELRMALREIVAELPELQRRIVWADALCPDGPVDSGVLAEELGIPSGTVRVYRKRGLERIRREMEKRKLSPPRG